MQNLYQMCCRVYESLSSVSEAQHLIANFHRTSFAPSDTDLIAGMNSQCLFSPNSPAFFRSSECIFICIGQSQFAPCQPLSIDSAYSHAACRMCFVFSLNTSLVDMFAMCFQVTQSS